MTPRARSATLIVAVALLTAGLALVYREFVLGATPEAFSLVRGGVTYRLLEPRWLGVAIALPLLIIAAARSLTDLPWSQRLLGVALRALFLLLLGLGLARPSRTATTENVATVFLVDVSDSVPDEALEDARETLVRAEGAKRPNDVVRLITFARRPRLVELASAQSPKERIPAVAALRHAGDGEPGGASDLEAALQLGYAAFPPGHLKRVVLLSDGNETRGDVLAEASRARAFGAKLYAIPYRQPLPAEVAVTGLDLPPKVELGEPFEVSARIHASRETKARARLFQGDTLNGLDGVRVLELERGNNDVRFKSVVRVGGEVTYRLELDQLGEDRFAANNAFSATLEVKGRPAVLYVDGQPQRASYLASALSAQQFDVDVRPASAFPATMQELERYAFVIVSDVQREALGTGAQELVEKYVRDLGGGFLFAGGESGFGLGGWANSTFERILPVRMDSERRKEEPSVAMTLVVDRSGSMTGLPIEMAKAACKATVSTLQGDDLIEVIAFDSQPVRYVTMQPARYRARIQNEISRIQPGGGTEIFRSLDMAYQGLAAVQARKKHVILLTDGIASADGIRDLAQSMLADRITVTAVGLGDGADGDLLRMVADAGGGRYHHVPDPNALPRIFTREAEMISRQAAVEEWFPVQQRGPADFLRGIAIESAPLLHGYVSTQLKPAPAQLVLASDREEPILARLRIGLGYTIAWTSDVRNLWASEWLRWPAYPKFWGQLVREHMRKKHRRELEMRAEMVGDRVHASVDAFTLDERFDNDIVTKLSLVGPVPKGERREVEMRQTAPGRYEADFPLREYGSFRLQVDHLKASDDGSLQPIGVSYGQVSNPYPREYAKLEPDLGRLERFAEIGGGSVDPEPAALFDPAGESIPYHEPLWQRFVLLAIALYLLDLLARRVRLFDRKFLPKPRRAFGAS